MISSESFITLFIVFAVVSNGSAKKYATDWKAH